jgi:formylglycine-generating enzyme required for sulfatase activity
MGLMAATLPPGLQLLRWRSRTEVFFERLAGLELAMVRIPAGSFVMGSPLKEPDRQDREGPQYRVELGEFLLGRTPITQAQWREVAEWAPPAGESWGRELDPEPSFFQTRSNPKARYGEGRFALLEGEPDSDQRPVEQVSWLDAMEFCERLSRRTGRTYTLPSEAQWEYACRAGRSTPFHFGATITPELANYNGTVTYGDGPKGAYRQQTTPVGMFPANPWGLQDMHGNVREWCLDQWHGSYEGAPSDGSAWVNTTGESPMVNRKEGRDTAGEEEGRLLRGGSWLSVPRCCRSAYRARNQPGSANNYVGFRVVCLPQGPSLNA